MKTSKALILILVILLLTFFVYAWSGRKSDTVTTLPPTEENISEIEGCYAVRSGKDVYTLSIQSETLGVTSGTLAFKNFEKDSSSGIFEGIYKDDILLGDYTFQSEGTESVMEVIFKKSGDDFIRGYGDVDDSGTRFTDPNTITFEASSPLSVFKKEACPAPAATQ